MEIPSALDLELAWPQEVFRSEAEWLLSRPLDHEWGQMVALLLGEAFFDDDARDHAESLLAADRRDTWTSPEAHGGRASAFLAALASASLPPPTPVAPHLSERGVTSKPLGSRRAGTPPLSAGLAFAMLSEAQALTGILKDWVSLVEYYLTRGYLEQALAGRGERVLGDVLGERLHRDLSWPPSPTALGTLARDLDLIEAVDDVVARPRLPHTDPEDGYVSYRYFGRRPAQQLYRRDVNALLARHGWPLRLALAGEDAGRLTRLDADHSDLVDAALLTARDRLGDDVRHAVAAFRGRQADRSAKRSAVVTLAGVLERRRGELGDLPTTRDEADLFEIANRFDIRHRKGTQHGDYDEAFLDWLFHWYLATIVLTDRLVARASGGRA